MAQNSTAQEILNKEETSALWVIVRCNRNLLGISRIGRRDKDDELVLLMEDLDF